MKNIFSCFVILLSISLLTNCTPNIRHADPFYDINGSDPPRDFLPLIKPVQAIRNQPSVPWNLELPNSIVIELPKSQEQEILRLKVYTAVRELEKFAVKDGVIMAYSSYINKDADPYILNNYYHWFVIVPSKDITEGFHTEAEFRQYIQTLGIQDPDWQTPDEAFHHFLETGGCLDWFPDCK